MRVRTSSTRRTGVKVRTFHKMLGLGNNSNQNVPLSIAQYFILSLQIFQFSAQMLLKLTELNCKLVKQLNSLIVEQQYLNVFKDYFGFPGRAISILKKVRCLTTFPTPVLLLNI